MKKRLFHLLTASLLSAAALAVSACVYEPAPAYPAYYYGPPAYYYAPPPSVGFVYRGGDWDDGWRRHRHRGW